jgi:hypothetical protein
VPGAGQQLGEAPGSGVATCQREAESVAAPARWKLRVMTVMVEEKVTAAMVTHRKFWQPDGVLSEILRFLGFRCTGLCSI